MANEPAYPLAPAAAEIVSAFFARHLATIDAERRAATPVPETAAIVAMVDAAFWASLRREEGRSTRISLAFVSKDLAGRLRRRDAHHFASARFQRSTLLSCVPLHR